MKTTLPLVFGFLVGVVMLIQYFTPSQTMLTAYNEILDWKQIVIGMTFILGVYSLMQYHGRKISARREGWGYSVVAVIGFAAMVLLGVLNVFSDTKRPFTWMFDNVQAPMQATMFSLLAFYVASASYRAFRARSGHATMLLVAGVVVMLGRVPLGEYFAIPGTNASIPSLADFVLDVPNLAAKRGILIGVGLGMVATAMKILLGIERTYLGKGSQ